MATPHAAKRRDDDGPGLPSMSDHDYRNSIWPLKLAVDVAQKTDMDALLREAAARGDLEALRIICAMWRLRIEVCVGALAAQEAAL